MRVSFRWPLLALILFVWALPFPAAPGAITQICALQGSGFVSPYAGQNVRTRGVVYADLDETSRRGFFMQKSDCDGDPETSDGIFVYLGEQGQVVAAGDRVEVRGAVWEYYGLTEIVAAPADVTVLSQGAALPPAVELSPPFENQAAVAYFERLEGMRVELDQGRVVGPTGSFERTWLVRADLGIERVFHDDPAGTGELVCADQGGLYKIDPPVRVGDLVAGLQGVLDYRYGLYCVQPLIPPLVQPVGAPAAGTKTKTAGTHFTVATFNLSNLFDDVDDPDTEDTDLSQAEYQRRLHKRARAIHDALGEPDVLAVQEVENETVLLDLVAQPEIQADYDFAWLDGPDRRGLDVALLFRTDRVQVLDFQARQGCTDLVDGLGPDGNLDVENPSNEVTCDSDSDQELDGNRLFSRPPLVVHLEFCPAQAAGEDEWVELTLIANHWKSKSQDTEAHEYTLERRRQQAQFVAGLAAEMLETHPGVNLVVLGDLNDHPDSQPLSILTAQGLADLMPRVEKPGRYTYIHQGVSQVIDSVSFYPGLGLAPFAISPIHVNADYPYAYGEDESRLERSSDHDPLVVTFAALDHWLYLPLVGR